MRPVLAAAAVLLGAACVGEDGATVSSSPLTTPSTVTMTSAGKQSEVVIRYRVERRTNDQATEDFAPVVDMTLTDSRGWTRAGFRFVSDPGAPYLVVLAEGFETDELCRPYDTFGEYSCQNGPVVAINADRWRSATAEWTGDVPTYRQMLVNHEVGHLIGMHHPDVQCPEPGADAPVMAQQSTELEGCLPNPWPLDEEVERAARRDLKIAPEFGE